MTKHNVPKWVVGATSVLLTALSCPIGAAVPVHLVRTDLEPLIREGARSPVQFAVNVPFAASVRTAGVWSVTGDRAVWRYAVRIPTAVSMSFHAAPVYLPAGATLTVKSAVTTTHYSARDVTEADVWSRIQPGDTLEFTLDVARSERSNVKLSIISLQAGYRGLGAGVPDHPYFAKLKLQQQAAGASSCAQNYMCNVTAANSPLAKATIGIIVANEVQCTGTLINDVPQDNAPYVLTARHCESGVLGGGLPGSAAAVTVYWDATTPCGQTLGALYDPGVVTQTGATTVVEQQDAWLIRLNYNPSVTDAQFAGFDASGGAIQGGYTVQHALGLDKQFTEWFGQAYAAQEAGVLAVQYTSDFWEVVNQPRQYRAWCVGQRTYRPEQSSGRLTVAGSSRRRRHRLRVLSRGARGSSAERQQRRCRTLPPSPRYGAPRLTPPAVLVQQPSNPCWIRRTAARA